MPRKPFVIEVGPFEEGGMNTGKAPQMLGPAEAATSMGVDYSDGTLKGFYFPAYTSSSAIIGSARYMNYRDGAVAPWRISAFTNSTCLDGCYGLNAFGISYYTNNTATPAQLLWSAGPNVTDVPLGLSAPAAPSVTTAGSGSVRSYRVTKVVVYTDSGITIESNPSPAVTPTGSSGCVLTFAAATPTDTTGFTNYTYVYASQLGATAANAGVTYFLVAQRASGTTSFTDSSSAFLLDATGANVQLTWQAGGVSTNTALQSPYVYDHSPAPNAYVVANALMGANASALNNNGNNARGGILLAAYGSTLYFSRSGMPWYFPLINTEVLDDTIEAIVVNQSSAYVLTQSSVYLVTGYDDTNLSITRTQATHGCLVKCGQGAVMTTHGLVYPHPLGIAILEQAGVGLSLSSRILTQDLIQYGTFNSITGKIGFGGFQDDVYIYCNGAGVNYMLDFAAWPRVRVTLADPTRTIVALAQIHSFNDVNNTPRGLWALIDNGGGTVTPRAFFPRLSSLWVSSGSLSIWTHTTGALTAGTTNKKKRFIRYWVGSNASANVLLSFYCKNWDGTVVDSLLGVTGSSWLPSTFTGDYLQVVIAASTHTDVFDSLRIEGEVYE